MTNSNVPYATYTAAGNELSSGMTETEALDSAQSDANERSEAIDVYQGSRKVATVEPELAGPRASKFFIAPANNRDDAYAAGYDGNVFDSREEAEREVPALAAALGTEPSAWIVSQY